MTANFGSYLLGGGGNSNDGLTAFYYLQINAIKAFPTELYGVDVVLTSLKHIVIGAATNHTIVRSNPNSVIGDGVGDAVVIGTSGNQDADSIIKHDVGSIDRTICILGDLVLKLIVHALSNITIGGKTTGLGDNGAVSGCIGIEQHLIASAITPNITTSQGYAYHTCGDGLLVIQHGPELGVLSGNSVLNVTILGQTLHCSSLARCGALCLHGRNCQHSS